MWCYEKRLQFPVNIKRTCAKTAKLIISQYGGPDGELSASLRYLSQRYTMPLKTVGGLLTDIGTEELGHMEMICAMVYQLTKICRWKRWKKKDLLRIISTIPRGSGRRQRQDFRFQRWNFSPKEMRSQT